MKKISIVIPCYNEEKTLNDLYSRVEKVFEDLPEYDYDVIFFDDYSKDNTRKIITDICSKDKRYKAIFNARNFGFHRNVFNALTYPDSDAVFLMFGDLQDPPEYIPEFVSKWEAGAGCVVGQRDSDEDNVFMKIMRTGYYGMIDMFSQKKHIRKMDGYGLYDKAFVSVLRQIDEVEPYMKSIIDEYGMETEIVNYHQERSGRGKSNFNFWRNYDFAMHGLTSSTKMLMRLATFVGLIVGLFSFIYAVSVIVRKFLFWDSFPIGLASIQTGVMLLGSVQLFFIGVLGEYILSINDRIQKKPRVVIQEKINID